MSNDKVYSQSGVSVFECAHPTVLVNKPLPRSQSLGFGPGYPVLGVPNCPDCNQPMNLKAGTADPAANQQGKDAYLASLQVNVNTP